jgi:glycosyltransferase involved in cell wall biosynthesis
MPRRLLLLTTDLEIGGTPTVVRELATRLHRPPRVSVEVACLAGAGPVVEQLRVAGIATTPLFARGVRDLGVVGRFVDLVRSRQFDTVYSLLVHANAVAAAGATVLPRVRFVQSIQTTQPNPRWHWTVQQLASGMARRVVVNTPSALRVARQRSHIDPAKLVLIPNAVEPAAFTRSPAAPRGDGVFRVGFIGRLDPVKRVGDLLQAMRRVPRGLELHVFGDGVLRPRLHTLVHELGIGDRVSFHGSIDRPQLALDGIDLLVLPSLAEGFGLVLIEAMAAGVPVIGTDVDGIRDVVQHEANGLLVPARRPDAIAAAIVRLRDDPALRQELAAGGRATVEQRYAWSRVLPMYHDLFGLR